MLLKEMFSAIGAPSSEQDTADVDWLGDLKFFIDNDDKLVGNYFFPAVKKHKENVGHPNIFKVYMRPLERCLEQYCNKFEIDSPEEKFPKDKLIELAKQIAEEQSRHLERGDYEN
jgi:hypothetical protein